DDDEDPINRVQKRVKDGEAEVEKLGGLFLPKLANARGVVLFVTLFAGLGAISFALEDLVTAGIITAAAGLLLGVGAWLLVRWLARKQTLTVGKELGRRLALAGWACKLLEDFADAE